MGDVDCCNNLEVTLTNSGDQQFEFLTFVDTDVVLTSSMLTLTSLLLPVS